MTEISRAPSGSRSFSTVVPAHGEDLSICTSTISRFSLRSSSRCTRSCSGTSCSTRPRMLEVAHTVGEMPSRSKCGWLRGSLTRAITFGTPYVSLHRLVLELGLEPLEAVAVLLDDRRLVTVAQQGAHHVGTGLAAPCDQNV